MSLQTQSSGGSSCSNGSFHGSHNFDGQVFSEVVGDGPTFSSRQGVDCNRWRDLFPLPLLPDRLSAPRLQSGYISIGSKRNFRRRAHHASQVNQIISTLNEMTGHGGEHRFKPSKAQKCAQQSLLVQVAHSPKCAAPVQLREAVHELLHLSPSSYLAEEEARSTVRSYNKGLVSLPNPGDKVFSAESLLDDIGRDILWDPIDKLFSPEVSLDSKLKPYMDDVLRNDSRAYHDFVGDLWKRGMLKFGGDRRSTVTPFFVAKKNGKLRLVLDCRASNQFFRPPPDIAMSAGYSFAQLELEPEDTMYVAQSDIQDYFYSIGLPDFLHPFFALPPIRPEWLAEQIQELQGWDHRVACYPQLVVIPMGWSWAMYFAQRIHQHQVMLGTGMSFEEILVDGRPAPLLRSVKAIAVPYADNLNIVGVSREHVQDLKDKAVARLREVGFRVHEEEDAQPHAKALGFILDGQRGRAHPIPEKRDRVIATLRWLSGRPRVSGRVLERVIGHCIHFFMLRRELLSIFRSVYDFKTAHYTTQKRLWRSAADECRWAANLLVICEADLKKSWSSTLTASDACLSGTATCSLELEPSEIRIMGSCRELWRFRSNDPSCKARDSVLALDPFKDVETVLPWHVLEDPFRINQQFPNVRKDVATSPEWKLQFSARMTKAEHITILEGRASLQSFRHKLRSVNHFGKRHLHLGDNLGMVLAFDRGRAKAIPLLFCCRRAAALSFASNSVFCHRWIPSEWNPADGPSRRWEKTRKVEVSARKKAKEVSKKIYPSKGQVDQCYIPSADIDPRFETSCSVGDQIIKSTNMRAIRSQVRGKNAEERSAKRASLTHNLQAPPRFNGQTALEVMAVSPRTSKDYQRRVLVFQGYCRIHQLETTTSCQIDHALTLFLNQGFSEGMDISEAAKFFASVMEANPVVGRTGLVRSKRALKGWKNLDPGNSRSPLAWPFISLMATTLMQLGLPHAALCILTMFSTYIRPSEALKIRCQDLVRSVQLWVAWAINLNPLESMEQSKVGLSDEAILLDSQGMDFLGPALERLRTGAAPTDLLFCMDYPTLHASWKKALISLNLPQDFAVLYQIRHSGASWDALRKYRSLLEIKLRQIRKRAEASPRLLKGMVSAFTCP